MPRLKPGSAAYLELKDQNNLHAVQHGGIGKSPGPYPFANLPVPAEWTKVEAIISFKQGVEAVKFGAFYVNHPNGAIRISARKTVASRTAPLGLAFPEVAIYSVTPRGTGVNEWGILQSLSREPQWCQAGGSSLRIFPGNTFMARLETPQERPQVFYRNTAREEKCLNLHGVSETMMLAPQEVNRGFP